MNILALMPDPYGGFGGIAQYNRDLLDSLAKSDRVEQIVSLTRHLPDSDPGLKPAPLKLVQHFLPGSATRYVMAALRHAQGLRPDAIVCGHINLLPVAGMLKSLTGASLILEAYGIEAWQRPRRMRSGGIKQVDLVIAISRFTREKLLAWSGLEPLCVKVVPNAVHLERYSQCPKPSYLVERYGLEGKLVLLTLGRLPGDERYKGQDRIIALLPLLAAEFPNLAYVIAGHGSDRPRLEALVDRMGLRPRVVFTGKITEEEKIDHYNLADAFAMPSMSEGFGFVFLEAAACGVPVLGGSRDGSRDALVDGRLGVMVDPENADELFQGLQEILRREKRVPEALAEFGFPRFEKQVWDLLANGKAQRAKR
ncbi:MAG: glycosyltransferase family 4 protein [Acidobacteriota bacterium]